MIAIQPTPSSSAAPSNSSLLAYWSRTIGLFQGSRVRISLNDGRVREGVLAGPGHLDVGDGRPVPIPLAQITCLETL
jgi:hypothetical protein